MPYLNREDILKVDDTQFQDVDVPEWGRVVRVRGLSGYDRNLYETSMAQIVGGRMVPEMSNRTAKLVARAIVDEDGNPMFNELDIARLGQKSGVALQRVFDVAEELSGINQAASITAAENLEPVLNDDSTSS